MVSGGSAAQRTQSTGFYWHSPPRGQAISRIASIPSLKNAFPPPLERHNQAP
jgi:hypothetical protein